MKGVNFVTNERNEKIAIQIDIKTLAKHRNAVENLLDIALAQTRAADKDISWEKAKNELRNLGKL